MGGAGRRCVGWAGVVLACLTLASEAQAGAWTLPAGSGLLIATPLVSRADHGFGGERDRARVPAFRKAEIQVLAEYGITDRFTLRGRTELRDVRREDAEPLTGLGFSEIGGRIRVWQRGGLVVSTEANLRAAEAQEIVDPADDGLWEGEYEGRLLAGYGFELAGRAAFVDLQGAYRARGGTTRPDEVRIDATLGVRPVPRVLVLAQSFSTLSVGAAEDRDGYDYHKAQLSGVLDVTSRVAVQLGGFATVAGRNALEERGALAAVWLRF